MIKHIYILNQIDHNTKSAPQATRTSRSMCVIIVSFVRASQSHISLGTKAGVEKQSTAFGGLIESLLHSLSSLDFSLSLWCNTRPPPHIRVLSPAAHISFWVSALQKSLTWCQVTLSIRHNACTIRTIPYYIHTGRAHYKVYIHIFHPRSAPAADAFHSDMIYIYIRIRLCALSKRHWTKRWWQQRKLNYVNWYVKEPCAVLH